MGPDDDYPLVFFSTKIEFDTSPFSLALVWIGILISLEISLGIIFRGIWSKMDYVHQVSFVPNLKGLGAEKQVIDKVAFKVIVLNRSRNMAKNIKEEVIDLDNGVELTMVLIAAGKFLMGSPQSEEYREDDEI